MVGPIRILLQTTIPTIDDDWHIGRFSLLRRYLEGLAADDGTPLFAVAARDRAPVGQPDPVLSTLDTSAYDELWLFAVDVGDGLTAQDCAGISAFRRRGGGLLVSRDHMDLGSSVCDLAGVGSAHYFHSKNQPPDPARRRVDDPYTTTILWPNYHSGANGDYQRITISGAEHPVLSGVRYLPAHPHEGGDIHLGPKNALEALALLGGGPFLPIHWGTFSLAMHAWDQPAETLLELGPKRGAQLVMPRLGEPVEPAHAERVEPWWRVVDQTARGPEPDTSAAISLPKSMPWPID